MAVPNSITFYKWWKCIIHNFPTSKTTIDKEVPWEHRGKKKKYIMFWRAVNRLRSCMKQKDFAIIVVFIKV